MQMRLLINGKEDEAERNLHVFRLHVLAEGIQEFPSSFFIFFPKSLSLRTCVLQPRAWPWCVSLDRSAAVASSCLFSAACFICLACIQPASAARRAEDLHVRRGESEKPPNGILHPGPVGDISVAGQSSQWGV